VRGVQLDRVEAGVERAPSGGGEGAGDGRHLVVGQCDRRGEPRERDGGRRHRRPAALLGRHGAVALVERPERRRLAPGVLQLHTDERPAGVHHVDDARPGLCLLVVPEPGVLRCDATLGDHRGGLGDHQPEPADRTRAEMDQVPVVRHAVDRRVLAHRGEPDPVADGGAAQGEGFEEEGHLASVRPP
jgi:hypothetical protein